MSNWLLIMMAMLGSVSLAGQKMPTQETDPVIAVSVTLNCSIDSAFHYFAANKKLERWLAKKADVEMKVGGKYELFWSPEDPDVTNNSTFGCKIIALDKPYYFSTEWRGNKDHKSFMNNVRPLTNVVVTFAPLSNSVTKVNLIHTGWRSGSEWESARTFFTHAWEGSFARLESIVNKK